MIDIDNAFTYSPVISLKHENAICIKIIYQESYKSILVSNKTNATCNWQVYSTAGTLMNRGSSLNTIINIPLSNAVRGTYVIVCKVKDLTQSMKFVVN